MHTDFMEESSEKVALQRLRKKLKENIGTGLMHIHCKDVNWMELVQDYIEKWVLVLPALNIQVILPDV
jgi:hypothetical protein